MTIEACVAHAIHKDLDILVALPHVYEIDHSQLESFIDSYVRKIQEDICREVICRQDLIKTPDILAEHIRDNVDVPPEMLVKMCHTIAMLAAIDARFIADRPDGSSIYYLKISLAI